MLQSVTYHIGACEYVYTRMTNTYVFGEYLWEDSNMDVTSVTHHVRACDVCTRRIYTDVFCEYLWEDSYMKVAKCDSSRLCVWCMYTYNLFVCFL